MKRGSFSLPQKGILFLLLPSSLSPGQENSIDRHIQNSHLSPDHKRKAMEALESQFAGKSPANFHNTPGFAPLSETKKVM
jgi:hypothetical protein